MRKGIIAAILGALLIIVFSGCHEHEWAKATCTEPEKCTICGKTEGEALGHKWGKATCTEPKICSVCGETTGNALGHKWIEATCTKPKTCSVCGKTEGRYLGHDWIDATCTEPKKCSRCDKTDGKALGHDVKTWETTKEATCTEKGLQTGTCERCGEVFEKDIEKTEHTLGNWVVTKEATCTEEGVQTGTCEQCGETFEQTIEKTGHTPGDWVVIKEAQWNSKGERTKNCTVCGAVLETEEYEMSPEEKENTFKATCTPFSYDQIARDPETYFLQHGVYTGKVVQVMEGDDGGTSYRVNITPTSSGSYTDTIYVECPAYVMKGKSRILEDDIVTLWGYNFETVTYKTIMGASVTIPAVLVEYIDVVE